MKEGASKECGKAGEQHFYTFCLDGNVYKKIYSEVSFERATFARLFQ